MDTNRTSRRMTTLTLAHITERRMCPTKKLLALVLASRQMVGGGYNTTSDLVAMTGLSERCLRGHMREAEDAGWVEILRGCDGNSYYLKVEGLAALPSVWGPA